ncbi:LysR substrate-binding domain-containing protein [Shewanella sp.]|uniref:LysR substrate-binding domain-containing protein n=1 Tax=Shewanella sp. TaxID=50422 RepID=UPI003F3E78CD
MVLNQQWLTTFVTLIEVGHFTRTAEKLFMTQPGVSQHIKKLEQQVGVPLLIRQGKSFELNQAGEMLYQYACQHRVIEAELLARLQRDDEYAGVCRFGCSGAIASLLYPHFLERQQRYSQLQIMLEAAPHQRIVAGILDNRLDIGIVTRADDEAELSYLAIGHAPLSLVLPSQYRHEQLDIALLNRIGFIDHPDGAYYLQQVLRANFEQGNSNDSVGLSPDISQANHLGANNTIAANKAIAANNTMGASNAAHLSALLPSSFNKTAGKSIADQIRRSGYVNQLSQILLPVSKGLGFTVLPYSTVAAFTPRASLWAAELNHTVQEPLYLVSKTARQLPARYQAFIDLITKVVAA